MLFMEPKNISSSNPFHVPDSIISQPLPRSKKAASLRVGNLMGHAAKMLNQLETQHKQIGISAEKLDQIYTNAHEQITKIESRIEGAIQNHGDDGLTKHEIKDLSKQLKSAEKEIGEVVRNIHTEVAIEAYLKANKGERTEVSSPIFSYLEKLVFSTLENNGLGAGFIRLMAKAFGVNQYAVGAFDAMKTASSRETLNHLENESEVDSDKINEFIKNNGNIDRRAGVIGLNGIYHFQAFFSEKKGYAQFKSFVAQDLTQKERKTIEREITIDEKKCKSVLVPLNAEFDSHLGENGTPYNVFGRIFGIKGISSTNRQEGHLINGWESNLFVEGKKIFQSLRHAITSDKYEKDPTIREANSKKAAEELLKAALLQEIASQDLTLQKASTQGIKLNLTSLSLVSPDWVRGNIPGQDDERRMLSDQVSALKSFQRDQPTEFELDGWKIPVNVKVNAFNFGVNAGALKSTKYKDIGGILAHQYDFNKIALKELTEQSNIFINDIFEKTDPLSDEMQKKINNALLLLDDINDLMKDKTAYLKGDNQYEVGAKLLVFTGMMDQITPSLNEGKAPTEKTSGFKGAFNCMSGKDRTGFMDAVAKTFALIIETGNSYPSHQALMENQELRGQFTTILKTMLLESGNLDITEINTDARGLKIKKEAGLFGMDIEDFLDVQGLSSTTSS